MNIVHQILFSDLLKIAKEKESGSQQVDGVILSVDVDIASIMKSENSVSQFQPIAKLCVTSMNRVLTDSRTIDIQKQKLCMLFLDVL